MNEIDFHSLEDRMLNVILTGYGLDHEFAVYTEVIESCGLSLKGIDPIKKSDGVRILFFASS